MNINYVIACFIDDGNIRQNSYHKIDKLYAVKSQIVALDGYHNPCITKATIIVNTSPHITPGEIEAIVAQRKKPKIPIEVKYRDNWGMSYGAWEYQIRSTLQDDQIDYYFLTEDDYCIADNDFYSCFFTAKNDAAYVCGMYQHNHPAISYGLVSRTVCQTVYDTFGEIFYTYNQRKSDIQKKGAMHIVCVEYADWQTHYHRHFLTLDYKFADIREVAPVFYRSSHHDTIQNFGQANSIPPIVPLL